MPDKRHHRGQHPSDAQLFDVRHWPRLREAVSDLSWLLERGYASASSLQLVGNRYQLAERQLKAVMRCACGESAARNRREREVDAAALKDRVLAVDGYNVLTTVEVALSDGLLFRGRDGCLRDIASLHGTFRRVEETQPALEIVGAALQQLKVSETKWFFDSPVSNSGRLKTMLQNLAQHHGWNWHVELVFDPDAVLKTSQNIVASADSVVLDACSSWFNLARYVVEDFVPDSQTLDLSRP